MSKHERPTLALIIPVRNALPFLLETLNSLRGQTAYVDEIILSDNCSTDGSSVLLQEFEKSVPNASYHTTPEFLEIGPSFNSAVSCSRSDWFYCLHSDDVLSPRALQRIRAEIEKVEDSVGLISFKAEIIGEDSRLKQAAFSVGRRTLEFGEEFISHNLGTSSINFGAVVIKRQAFLAAGEFPATNSYWLDLRFYHQLVLKFKILKVPVTLLRYRTYDRERTSDNRKSVTLENDRFWREEYLPELFLRNPNVAPKHPKSRNRYLIALKFRANRFAFNFALIPIQRVVRFVLLNTRLRFDKIGIGAFAEKDPTLK
jgi:glycosyltransferase involved in cell wall biosynthesis